MPVLTCAASPWLFPQGKGPIWVDDVRCTGNETLIDQCNRSPWGVHDCDHTEDGA